MGLCHLLPKERVELRCSFVSTKWLPCTNLAAGKRAQADAQGRSNEAPWHHQQLGKVCVTGRGRHLRRGLG